jgi:hypothetical protein
VICFFLFFLSFFLSMICQGHSLVIFFCYINEIRTILCGSFKKINNFQVVEFENVKTR